MPKKFTSIWGERKSVKTHGRPTASADADDESGDIGDTESEDRRKSLYALKALRDRGLMSEDEYERRRAVLEG